MRNKKLFIISTLLIAICTVTISAYADTHYQTTATKTTKVGNPVITSSTGGGTGNAISDSATTLLAAIQNSCQVHAQYPNSSFVLVRGSDNGAACLDGMVGIDQAIIAKLKASANAVFGDADCSQHLQCVGFADAVAARTDTPLPPVLLAKDYATTNAPGYTWHNQGNYDTQVGDVAVWGGCGNHVAIVTKVWPDNRFDVAEANGCYLAGITDGGSVGIETSPNQNAIPYKGYNDCYQYLGYLRQNQ